ncbi:E3 ubiquitin-protein ligase rad18 [Polyrhizophydium stewartii]|uniref:Postreplication repair E3 ubiquitin-protein ligase RAD18 n=1 Tax=Polyrhizophydium stewartii TaxID=2732419 RepID=A0ABR4NAF7_9FUNG|nr:E3 ubiquitin-protein ligase rad18 [Polyrhizophydium stewartii]
MGDWPHELVPFAAMDESLRCAICKELLSAAMALPCVHSFCSLCIRRHFQRKLQCPSCRTPVQGVHVLKNNRLLDDLVAQFRAIRDHFRQPLIDLLAQRAAAAAASAASATSPGADGRKNLDGNLDDPNPLASQGADADAASGRPAVRSSKRRRTSAAPTHSQDARLHDPALDADIADNDSDSEFEDKPVKVLRPARPRRQQHSRIDQPGASSMISPSSSSSPLPPGPATPLSADRMLELQPQGDDAVDCPICAKRVLAKRLNAHLDNQCRSDVLAVLAVPSQTDTQPRRQPKPSVAYSILSDAKIRRKLEEDGLPTTGTRAALIRRHTEWTTLFNANLDSHAPRSDDALRAALAAWERAQAEDTKAVQASSFRPSTGSHDATPEDTMLVQSHVAKYAEEFEMLIQQIRDRKARRLREQAEAAAAGQASASELGASMATGPIASTPDADGAELVGGGFQPEDASLSSMAGGLADDTSSRALPCLDELELANSLLAQSDVTNAAAPDLSGPE